MTATWVSDQAWTELTLELAVDVKLRTTELGRTPTAAELPKVLNQSQLKNWLGTYYPGGEATPPQYSALPNSVLSQESQLAPLPSQTNHC